MSIKRDQSSKRQPCWLLDYVDENRFRHRKRVYCSQSVAQRLYLQILDEIEKRKSGIWSSSELLTLGNLANEYLINSEVNRKDFKTVKRIQNACDAFQRIIGSDTLIGEISPHLIERFKQKRLTQKTPRNSYVTPGGLNCELKHLRALFNFAVKMGYLNRSPFIGISLVQNEAKPIRFLTFDELNRLFSVINSEADKDASDLILTYLQTGARRSELIPPKLGWNNINLNRGQILLIGKRKRKRTLPLNNILIGIFQSRLNHGYPFDYSPDQVSRLVKRYFQKAEINEASVHTLRKTCGALLIHAEVDIFRVSKWLGHSSVTVTERHYVDLLRSDYEDLSRVLGKSSTRFVPLNSVLPL